MNHKRLRRIERDCLLNGEDIPEDPSEVWWSAKDGKFYFKCDGWDRK